MKDWHAYAAPHPPPLCGNCALARISGWNQPDAVAVAAVVLTPEERARRFREIIGLPEPEEGGAE